MCSFGMFANEKVDDQAGDMQFSMEQINCFSRILRDYFCNPRLLLESVLRAFTVFKAYVCIFVVWEINFTFELLEISTIFRILLK